jgi:plasmid maintenance system antidote protein VapI
VLKCKTSNKERLAYMAKKEEISNTEILSIIRQMVDKWGSQKKVADHLGISNAYMSDILAGNRDVSDTVARKLGYKRVVKYAPDGNLE